MKSIGSELAFMRVLRLGLGNTRAVSAFVTVCKFGRSLIRRENVCANFRVFVHVVHLALTVVRNVRNAHRKFWRVGLYGSIATYSPAKVCYVKKVVYCLNYV